MTIQKNLARNNSGSRNNKPCPNPNIMEILSFSKLSFRSWRYALVPQAMLSGVARSAVRYYHDSRLFFERYDISFHSLQQSDMSLYSIYDISLCWLQKMHQSQSNSSQERLEVFSSPSQNRCGLRGKQAAASMSYRQLCIFHLTGTTLPS